MKVINTQFTYGHRGPYEVDSIEVLIEEMMPCFRVWVEVEEDFATSQYEASGQLRLPDQPPFWLFSFGDYANFAEWRLAYHIEKFKSGLKIVDG